MRKLVVLVAAVLALLLVADRVAPLIASGVVAQRIQTAGGLPEEPAVSFHGFPFLDQALRGVYDDVEVTASGVEIRGLHDVRVNAHFRGLHAPLGDVVRGNVDEVPVDRVHGTVTVRYDDLSAASQIPDLTLTRDGADVRVRTTVAIAGQQLTVSARAVFELSGSDLVVRAQDPAVDGGSLPPGVADAVVERLSFVQSLEGLPYGLRVTGVRAVDEGLAVAVTATDVVLTRGGVL